MTTVTAGRIRRPNGRQDARTQIAATLLQLSGRVVRYREGAPSPCCHREWLARQPHNPGHLACSGCGTDPRRHQ